MEDGHTCEDVDECSTPAHNCSHLCNNTPGSYHCHCRDGFELEEDDRRILPLPL
jgi:hypothetical protein